MRVPDWTPGEGCRRSCTSAADRPVSGTEPATTVCRTRHFVRLVDIEVLAGTDVLPGRPRRVVAGRNSKVAWPAPPSDDSCAAVRFIERRWREPGGDSAMVSVGASPSSAALAGDRVKNRLLPVTMPSVVSPHVCRPVKPESPSAPV